MQNQQCVFAAVMASSNGQQQEAPELAMFNPSAPGPDRTNGVPLNVQQLPDPAHNHLLQRQQGTIPFPDASQPGIPTSSANMYSDSLIMTQPPPHSDSIVDPNFAWVNDMLQANVQDGPFDPSFSQQQAQPMTTAAFSQQQQPQRQQQPSDQQMFMQTMMIQTHQPPPPSGDAPQTIQPISSSSHIMDVQQSFPIKGQHTASQPSTMDGPNKKRRTMPAAYPSQPSTDQQDLRIISSSLGEQRATADQLSNASTTPEGTLSPATPSVTTDEKTQRRVRRPQLHHTASAPLATSSASSMQPAGTAAPSCPTEYATMTRQELIARLVELEQEKRATSSQSSPVTPEPEAQPSEQAQRQDGSHQDEQANDEIKCLWKDCGQEFSQVHELSSHLRDVHVGSGKPTYRCEWAGCPRNDKPFMKRHKMHTHLRTHTGERPFVCPHPGCTKRFPRPDSLTTHIKTHTNSRPYTCSYLGCEKAYLHVRSLKKHEQTHKPPYSIAGTMPDASYPPPMHHHPLPVPSPPDSIHPPAFVSITQPSFIEHTSEHLQMQ